jgi:phosphatidylglycerol:prolipoprotein diacylglycerol transferase
MILASVLWLTNRHAKRFAGYNVAMLAMLYAPVRFGFDYLRVADAKYLGFTPGQFFSVAIFALGLWIYISRSRAAVAEAVAPAPAPASAEAAPPAGRRKSKR